MASSLSAVNGNQYTCGWVQFIYQYITPPPPHTHTQSGGGRTDHSSKVHTCMSIEGLNQEVSWVLEGEPSMMVRS